MWFSSVLLFHCEFDKPVDIGELLAEEALKPCPPHARSIQGWLPITESSFAQDVAGATLICMGKEERVLPRSVIQRELEERVQEQETQLQRQLKRSEKSQMAEEIEFELLPKAFRLQKRQFAFLDSATHRLVINTSSTTQAEQFTALLRKSLPGISITPIEYPQQIEAHFSQWISQPQTIPASLQLAADCVLFSPDNEKKRINCKGCELPAEEILSLLNQGFLVEEISLQWQERIQFTLTQDFSVKRIKCLDYLLDDFNALKEFDDDQQQQDAALALLSGELRTLINDLLNHLSLQPLPNQTPTMALNECLSAH